LAAGKKGEGKWEINEWGIEMGKEGYIGIEKE
jgi:hypothetical protein